MQYRNVTDRRTDGQNCYINIVREYADARTKLDSICESYAQMKKGSVFWLTLYIHEMVNMNNKPFSLTAWSYMSKSQVGNI